MQMFESTVKSVNWNMSTEENKVVHMKKLQCVRLRKFCLSWEKDENLDVALNKFFLRKTAGKNFKIINYHYILVLRKT